MYQRALQQLLELLAIQALQIGILGNVVGQPKANLNLQLLSLLPCEGLCELNDIVLHSIGRRVLA